MSDDRHSRRLTKSCCFPQVPAGCGAIQLHGQCRSRRKQHMCNESIEYQRNEIISLLFTPCLQVVARYGYMDIVDHGPEFVEHMKDYIKDSIKATYLQTRLGTAGAGAGGLGAGGYDSNGVQGAKTLSLTGPGGGLGAGGGGEEGFFGRGTGDGAYGGGGGGGGGGAGSRSMSRVVSGSLAGEEVFYGGLQDELDLLDTAYDQGVVYYLGRTRIRMKKL